MEFPAGDIKASETHQTKSLQMCGHPAGRCQGGPQGRRKVLLKSLWSYLLITPQDLRK